MKPGIWSTPAVECAVFAPNSRLQRRVPTRTYQAHYRVGELKYSQTFRWSADPEGQPNQADHEKDSRPSNPEPLFLEYAHLTQAAPHINAKPPVLAALLDTR